LSFACIHPHPRYIAASLKFKPFWICAQLTLATDTSFIVRGLTTSLAAIKDGPLPRAFFAATVRFRAQTVAVTAQ
jgi:hypothetical protein